MTGSGHCHGPGCTQETSGDFCGEPCWRKWHGQHADTSKPGATILMTWTHPTHGRIEEHVCEVHERAILAALRALDMGCSGERFDALQCVRCTNLGRDTRMWLPACAVADEGAR